eukprot:TRINITY_DN484_c0_g1_i2.p1 TRINITY_DN484_c0_g1~~TRINITY_DN484_c0_g1_i2.p1  ORF type:complete len:133 (+),score=21.25 TRINITY_DN484_c0_g1_i2:39-437(+)
MADNFNHFNKWGRTLALSGAYCLAFGCADIWIADYDSEFKTALGIYSGVLAIVIWFFWYPVCGPCKVLQIAVQNFFIDAIMLIVLAIFCFWDLPTQMGGLCLVLSSIAFFIGGVKGEKGMSLAECQGKKGKR